MWEESYSLFPQREEYRLTHTERGKNVLFNTLPKTAQRKMACDNMHLVGNMKFTEENGFPILAPFNPDTLDFELYSYKNRNHHRERPWAVHFFQHNYTYIHAITRNLEVTTAALAGCSAVFTPDCSLYVDAPMFINKQNIFRSRFAGAYWQSCGYNVIQTASWADANSLRYSFEGLAEHSLTAVCGIGHEFSRQANRLWKYAVEKLIETKSPTTLIVYGGKQERLPDFGIPTVFFQDSITKYFRRK